MSLKTAPSGVGDDGEPVAGVSPGAVSSVQPSSVTCTHIQDARIEAEDMTIRTCLISPGSSRFEALGEDVRGDPGDLAEQVIEPLRPAEQRLDHQ
jgi:hypothetical protein